MVKLLRWVKHADQDARYGYHDGVALDSDKCVLRVEIWDLRKQETKDCTEETNLAYA